MTLAPQSASWRTAVGPARACVRSSTVKRDSGRLPMLTMAIPYRREGQKRAPLSSCRDHIVKDRGGTVPLLHAEGAAEAMLQQHGIARRQDPWRLVGMD